jgi:hypothetical protein
MDQWQNEAFYVNSEILLQGSVDVRLTNAVRESQTFYVTIQYRQLKNCRQ